jgi:chromosome transmission fidelity protein 1
VHDIEELAERSQRGKICGYYAARNVALSRADVIVAPYQSILSESARQSLGIESLADKILVFDEAHNLMETITSLNSIKVQKSQFDLAFSKIQEYLGKYGKRMAPQNVKSLNDISQVFQSVCKYLDN